MTDHHAWARGCVLVSMTFTMAAVALPVSVSGQSGCRTQSRRVTLQITEQPYGSLPSCGVISYAAVFPVKSPDLPANSYVVVQCPGGFDAFMGRFFAADVTSAPTEARWLRRPGPYLLDNYRAVPARHLFLFCRRGRGA